MVASHPQCGEKKGFFSHFPVDGLYDWGILLVIPLALREIKHQHFLWHNLWKNKGFPQFTYKPGTGRPSTGTPVQLLTAHSETADQPPLHSGHSLTPQNNLRLIHTSMFSQLRAAQPIRKEMPATLKLMVIISANPRTNDSSSPRIRSR